MMPDLGNYTAEVLLAYGISLALILALIGWSLWRAKAARRELDLIEARLKSRSH